MASISPFNILLNNLSSDLSKLNLHNLVNVCGELISEVERERISSGWDVFKILIRRDAIGEEPRRMAFLLRIIKELRPKRRDLVSMVKNFIEDNYDQPQEILDDFESSSDEYTIIQRSPRPVSREDCCINIRCGCCSCNLSCNHCCSWFCCLVIAAMILILSAVILAVLYYTPYCRKHLNITNDVNSVEVIVTIGVLFFLALCFIFLGIYIKRTNRKLPYRRLQSDIGVTTVPRCLSSSAPEDLWANETKTNNLVLQVVSATWHQQVLPLLHVLCLVLTNCSITEPV